MSDVSGDMTSAVESAFAAASTPDAAPTTTVDSSSAPTSEAPTGDVSHAATSDTTTNAEPGPIPYTRFKEVNDKYGAASKELESLGWAKGFDQQTAHEIKDFLQRSKANPLAITEQLELVRDHPVLGPQLRSWAARTLGFRTPSRQEPPADESMPEPDLQFEDGRRAYSAEQMQKRDQFLLKQWESKIDEKIAPIAKNGENANRYVADQVMSTIKAKADVDAKSEIDSLSQRYPQFNEHKKAIADAMEQNPSYTLKQAWAEVFIEKVGPQLAGQQAAAVKQKVNAGSANPARPSGAPVGPPKDFDEALRQLLPARN